MAYVRFILILLVIPSISTGIEPYTVSVEADDKLAEFADIFRKTLAKYGHVRIVANEKERQQIIHEWNQQVMDSVERSSRVEMGELQGWKFKIQLFQYLGETKNFGSKLVDLAKGEVTDLSVNETDISTAARRLAHDVARQLHPRVIFRKWKSEQYGFVYLDGGKNRGLFKNQKLLKRDRGKTVARLKIVNVREMGCEAEIESGHSEIGPGDTLIAIIPEIPIGEACLLRVIGNSIESFHVSVNGQKKESSIKGVVEISLWPGTYKVDVSGSFVGSELIHLTTSGYTWKLSDDEVQSEPAAENSFPMQEGMIFIGNAEGNARTFVDNGPFFLDEYEVTVDEFRSVFPEYKTLDPKYRSDAAVYNVSWGEAYKYCKVVGKRLPTENEWEQACKGPESMRFGYGNIYDPEKTDARTTDNRLGNHPVRGYNRNGYGVADMTGGVWEWCTVSNGGSSQKQVLRGGAWRMKNPEENADCRFRLLMDRNKKGRTPFGFRCATDIQK